MALLIEVTRQDRVESRHHGEVVVADASGRIIATTGAPNTFAYFRSSAKPFQSIPLIESGAADAFGFDSPHLALACASHNASPRHQRFVAAMLASIGLAEPDLRCGHSPPADEREAARITLGLKRRDQIQCECSGEHAGMLAACVHLGYPTETYADPNHPLQRRILAIIGSVLRLDPSAITVATDGCSLPTFGAPLHAFATAYAILAAPGRSPLASSITRLRQAMLAHPALISADGVLDTDLMRLTNGRVVAKLGAEGLLCLAIPKHGLGIAIKSLDGLPRALGAAAIGTLEQLALLDGPTLARLREHHLEPIRTFRGEPVGQLRPVVRFSSSHPLGDTRPADG